MLTLDEATDLLSCQIAMVGVRLAIDKVQWLGLLLVLDRSHAWRDTIEGGAG